ncbi:MAG: enoyl-CoA hydratase/isomerase family protein [Candidatus Hodarchaeales archaeon]|jgi:enoyl-CoA hydratase
MFKNISFEVSSDGVVIITFIREKALNAINVETLKELKQVIDQIEDEANKFRILVFKGKGRAFIAGADINEFKGITIAEIKNLTIKFQKIITRIEMLPIPTIAVIDGFAFGAGCELAMACDFRFASTRAVFGQPEIKLGLIPGAGGTQRLPRLIGKTRAKEMILLGDNIDAETALNIGLVNKVVPPDDLDSVVDKAVKRLASGPRFAISQAKEAIDRGTEMSWFDAIQMEANLCALCFTHEDLQEGVTAFLEKRKPNFK